MLRPTNMEQFNTGDWNRLQEAAERFEQCWRDHNDVDLATFLPSAEDPLHGAILEELVKIDLEMRRSRGQAVSLDNYLEKYPQLGDAQTLPARLIYEEYRVLRRFGEARDPEHYRQRFPNQFPELQRLIDQESLPAEHETPCDPSPPSAKPRASMILQNGNTLPVGEGYRLIECIGDGSFGEVWRVEAPGGFPAAIKIVRRTLDSQESQREMRALEVIKRLSHPHLLKTQAAWALQDRLIILMDLADCTLRDRLHECKTAGASGIPPAELLRYFREAAEALDYLHAEGVLHRDVKPQNLLLCRGHVKVADFGLVRDQNQHQRSHSTAGTPGYMAAEAWRGAPCAAGDQYSLALTYAELRLGRWPFDATDPMNVMLAHIEGTPDLAQLDEAERGVLLRSLAKNPAERFPNCQTFVSALHDSLMGGVTGPDLPEALRPRPVAQTREMPRFETKAQAVQPPYGTRRKAPVTKEMEQLPSEGTIFPSADGDANLPFLKESASLILPSDTGKPEKAPGGHWQTASKPHRSLSRWIALAFVLLVAVSAGGWYIFSRPPQDTGVTPIADAPQIVRRFAGQEVVFLLIQPKEEPNEEPFYLMENKVRNGLFRAFVHEREIDDRRWQSGGVADGRDVGSDDEDLPVLRVTRPDAKRCAAWMGGQLPTARQLDLAFGNADPPKAAAVDRIRLGPRKITETHDDISPYGIRDLRGNGREWTRDNLAIKGDNRTFAVLRGRSYTAPTSLLRAHLDEWKTPELCPTQLADYASPYTGFRVVLPKSAAAQN